MKTPQEYFKDWEGYAFGYGYGSGEPYIIPALMQFFTVIGRDFDENAYDYEILEAAVDPVIAWLLINRLCALDLIEYGTSPRFGWLTKQGIALRHFLADQSADDLITLVCAHSEDETPCYPDYCNCDDGPCENPFWVWTGDAR